MAIANSTTSVAPPRGFQFRIATLLVVTVWIGLSSAGVANPTSFWAGALLSLALLSLLMGLLLTIYRAEAVRAFAVGFLIFCGGYLMCAAVLDQTLRRIDYEAPMPTSRAASWVFRILHGQNRKPMAIAAGTFRTGTLGPVSSGPASTGPPAAAVPGTRVIQVPIYNPENFVEIVHSVLATLLGLVGGMIAQYLYLTRHVSRSWPILAESPK